MEWLSKLNFIRSRQDAMTLGIILLIASVVAIAALLTPRPPKVGDVCFVTGSEREFARLGTSDVNEMLVHIGRSDKVRVVKLFGEWTAHSEVLSGSNAGCVILTNQNQLRVAR